MKISETDRGRKTLSDATESFRGRNNISVMILVDNMGRNNRHIAYRGGVPVNNLIGGMRYNGIKR